MGGKRGSTARSPLPGILIPPSWQAAADNIAYDSNSFPPPITFILGPENSGKSTFSRHLLNTLLKRYKRVAYLDTDVAQPEFTTSGCLSLHIIDKQIPDPTIIYLKKPERCLFFGHVSAKQDSETYSSCVNILYDYFYQEYYQTKEIDNPCKILLPIIISTSVWAKSNGYDILVAMLQHTSPTHVVRVCFPSEIKTLPSGLFWLENPQRKSVNLVQICAADVSSDRQSCREILRKEACMMQDARLIAYFIQCLPREMNFSSQEELAEKLASIPCNRVPLSNVEVKYNGHQVLTGSIVGLGVTFSALTETSTPWCVGLGIVRAFDSAKGQLFLLTPVPPNALQNVQLIMQSTIDIPACLRQVSECISCEPVKVLKKRQLGGMILPIANGQTKEDLF